MASAPCAQVEVTVFNELYEANRQRLREDELLIVQGQVRKDMRAGNVRSLREIEQRVLPSMPGMEYLGPEYDPAAMVYRLKFIRQGRVVFVDVDARSGNIISQSR